MTTTETVKMIKADLDERYPNADRLTVAQASAVLGIQNPCNVRKGITEGRFPGTILRNPKKKNHIYYVSKWQLAQYLAGNWGAQK